MVDLIVKVRSQEGKVEMMVDKMNRKMDDLMPDCKTCDEVNERLAEFQRRDDEVNEIDNILVEMLIGLDT